MASARILTTILLAAVLAGCLSDGDGHQEALEKADTQTRESALDFLVQDHDHMDASLHAASMNLERLGYSNGVDDSGDVSKIPGDTYYTELAVQGDYAYLARSSVVDPTAALPTPGCPEVPSNDPSRGGFVILNIQDPAHPHVVGTYNALGGSDIEIDRTGDVAFFTTQRNCLTEIGGNLQEGQDPSDVLPRGIHVVDIHDKTAPSLLFYQPLPINGPHTLSYWAQDDQEFLIVSTYDLYSDPLTGGLSTVPVTQRVMFFQIERDPVGDTDNLALVPVNTFFLTDRAEGGDLYFPHDAIAQVHPKTGQSLLYVAYWDKGVQIVDISDMQTPLSAMDGFTEFSPSSRNNIHQARPFDELIDGRHVTVAEPEIISADETGYITFLDTSDPTDIQKLGHWTLPGDLFISDLEFSPHNFDTFDGKVALAHNHAGLWIIDVGSAEDLAHPKTVGYFLDVEQRTDSPRMQPYFWGAFEQDGVIFASDESSGLYTLRYTGP